MDIAWMEALIEWVDREKHWIFSGVGLTLLAGILFFARWILGFLVPQEIFATLGELYAFQVLVDERFKVLNSWIQLIYSRQTGSHERDLSVGFHESSTPFLAHDSDRIPIYHGQSKPSVNDLRDISDLENEWSEGLASMKRLKTQAQLFEVTVKKINSARKILFACATISLVVGVVIFLNSVL